MSSSREKARGRSSSMKRCVPRMLSRPDLDEDAGRFLDVVAGGLHEARHLAQLRDDPPGPLRQGRVVEQRLTGEAGRDDVGVELRIALPGPDPFELEEPGADAVLERRSLEPLDVGQPAGVDGREPTGEGPEVADLPVDRLPAEVLEQVVMQVDTVEGCAGGMNFVQVREVLVNEVRKGFG